MLGRDDAVNTAQTREAGSPGEGSAHDQLRRRTEVADVILDSQDVSERSFAVVFDRRRSAPGRPSVAERTVDRRPAEYVVIDSSVSPRRERPDLAPRKRIRHYPADVKRPASLDRRAGTSERGPDPPCLPCSRPQRSTPPQRQPSSTAPVYGAMVRLLTWVPVGVVMVAPRFTVTVDEEGFTSTRPLVNVRWYTPPMRY